jgi:hypothetical protein
MSSPQYTIKRKIPQVAIVENGQPSFDIPRGYDIASIGIRLNCNVQVTVTGAAVRAEAPAQLIRRVELTADGKNTICSFPLALLNRANPYRRGGQLGSLVPPSGFGVATYTNVSASGFLDQQLVDGIRAKDSNLRTEGMSALSMRFSFGAANDLFTGTPTALIVAATGLVNTWLYEYIELAAADGSRATPLFLIKRSYQDYAFAASNANLDIALPVGNVMRGVILRAEGAVTAQEPSDAVINNVILRSNQDVRLNLPYLDLREANKMDYSPSTLPVGIAHADMMAMGSEAGTHAADGWDLTGATQATLTLDVTGATNTKVTIGTVELVR